MSRALLAVALLGSWCVANRAQADDFSWDLFGGVSQGSLGDQADTDGSALSANYYFAPVDDSRGPYELASFLDPASRISAALSHQKTTYHPLGIYGPGTSLADSTTDYTVGGRYVLPASKWYAGGDYTKTTVDSGDVGIKAHTYRVLAGKYLGPNTSLELAMSREAQNDGGAVRSVTEAIGPSFVHVRHFRSLSYSIFGSVTQTNTKITVQSTLTPGFNENYHYWTYSLGTELFPTTKLGFRVGYTQTDSPLSTGAYDVAATWFVKPNIGIQIGWSQQQYDSGILPHNDTANLRLVGRF